MRQELELYIHIPFCMRKCAYCDFLSFASEENTRTEYVRELKREIESWESRGDYVVPSVFIGGGTPSVLKGEEIASVMELLRKKFQIEKGAEITIEANPGTLDQGKLKAYRQAGINRLSLGLQSACNEELKILGRIHTYEEFLESFSLAREAGFSNINVDLISGLPGQTVSQWEDSLRKTGKLGPEHISAYGLIIEEGTLFYRLYHEDARRREKEGECRLLPSEEEERAMYRRTREILEEYGYHRYEISNYSLEGKECRHNLGYWTRKEYKGFGLGAASLLDNRRYSNTRELKEYLKGRWNGNVSEKLERKDQMEEMMFLGLRMRRGVGRREFKEAFHREMEDIYGPVIGKMKDFGLLEEEQGRVRLTERGIDVSNYVCSEFLLDSE